jgi:hypothetical protein
MLLRAHADTDAALRRPLVRATVERIDLLRDWSLLALSLRQAVDVQLPLHRAVLSVTARILAALEEQARVGTSGVAGARTDRGPTPGYEPAALAVAAAAARMTGDSEPVAAVELAELLRSIARLSRSREVVREVDGAVRALLGLSEEPAPGN